MPLRRWVYLMHRESPRSMTLSRGVPIWVMLSRSVLIFPHLMLCLHQSISAVLSWKWLICPTETRCWKEALDLYLRQSDKHYDYVFIDCPPSLGLLVINAMCAVTEMLIPIQAEYYALEGLGQLINTIGLVQEHFNPVLLVSTMLVTMFDRRTLLSREVYNEVKGHYPSIVLNTTIPRSVKISERRVSPNR